MTDALKAKLDALAELEAAATKGPWIWSPCVTHQHLQSISPAIPLGISAPMPNNRTYAVEVRDKISENTGLLAEARNSLPALLRLVRALLEEREAEKECKNVPCYPSDWQRLSVAHMDTNAAIREFCGEEKQ